MNGYKIYYLDELGKSAFTWFGEPLMSDGLGGVLINWIWFC